MINVEAHATHFRMASITIKYVSTKLSSFAFSRIRLLSAADAGLELVTSARERDDLPCPHWNGVKNDDLLTK